MFAKNSFIPEDHKVVLRQVVRQRLVAESLITQAYRAASDAIEGRKASVYGVRLVTLKGTKFKLVRAAMEKEGVFVELTQTDSHVMLSVGEIWCQQHFDGNTQTLSAKVW